uniref:DUF3523 domain-containing protein n=1 Tax=Angiostrongylus cantonensis TaxID=6313 RepID=A0A0K0D165_ANGCA
MEMQQHMKLLEDQREAAERRAEIAEAKVADYEKNFIEYRGQMEGEAIRAITNGYRNALSTIPSSRREGGLSIDRLFPLRLSNYCENVGGLPVVDLFRLDLMSFDVLYEIICIYVR